MYVYGHGSPLAAWDGFGEPAQSAQQVYAAQSRVRELTDRTFQTMFADRNKVIVVAFWANSCRPCDAVANTVVSVAEKVARLAFAKQVKFYHAQWDPAVNPRLHRQYGFSKIPVVYFYYTAAAGRQIRRHPFSRRRKVATASKQMAAGTCATSRPSCVAMVISRRPRPSPNRAAGPFRAT